ncbi:L-aspartate oxidase [Leucobacter sp. NPDC058333]|uniref:L-aspartate oxidase n=1 Tax=Leucobacter sp. NPDC058333 TaxID=3346450 RepID=UPI00366791E4
MILVIGSGVAGMSAALTAVRHGGEAVLVTPGPFGNTPLAQGGIAAAIGAQDREADHLADTLVAGAGLTDPVAAAALVRDGARIVRTMLADGFPADRDADGSVSLGLEAAHGRARIVHAGGDRTGAALHAYLVDRVQSLAAAGNALTLIEGTSVEQLLVAGGVVRGAIVRDATGCHSELRADAVVLATGGYASLYPVSSNHPAARGAGVVLAARAGALVADLEFVQFHPTVLVGGPDGARGFLISEALRGAGAVLRNASGERYMLGKHPLAELAPRDIVSLETHRALQRSGDREVWLDATAIERDAGAGALAREFPGISRILAELGLDWRTEPVPVAPAAHYTMGGVASDLQGRTSHPGLFVAGEVAATGVHGANRLASNSLLEGLVFGARAGRQATAFEPHRGDWALEGNGMRRLVRDADTIELPAGEARGGCGFASDARELTSIDLASKTVGHADEVSGVVGAHLGIERSGDGLATAARILAHLGSNSHGRSRHGTEPGAGTGSEAGAERSAALAAMICAAATARTESRGAQFRSDHPNTDPAQARRRAFHIASRAVLPAQVDMRGLSHHANEQRSVAAC